MSEHKQAYVSISPHGDKIMISWGCETRFRKKDNGRLTCYIPAFNIYFSASDRENVLKKSSALTGIFMDHFIQSDNKNKIKNLVLQLHRLGFRAPQDNMVVKQFANNSVVSAKFKSMNPIVPPDFYNTERIKHESNLEVAV